MEWLKIQAKADAVQEIIGYVLLSFSAALACFEVFSRYLFASSHGWMEEIVKLSMISSVLVTSGVVLKKGGHIRVDFILHKFSRQKKEMIELGLNLITLSVCALFFYSGIRVVQNYIAQGVTSPTEIQLPMFIIFLPFPIGFGLLSIYSAGSIVNNIRRLAGKKG